MIIAEIWVYLSNCGQLIPVLYLILYTKKEPDGSWIPASLPDGRTKKWPSVGLEVRYSESLARPRVDAAWWLSRSKGDVKVVLTISINVKKPQILIENGKRT